MKPTDEEFEELRKAWYKRLADTGFKDIETFDGQNVPIVKRQDHFFMHTNNDVITSKREYYTLITHNVNDLNTRFKNEVDKYVLSRHAEGARISVIVNELKMQGNSRTRKSVSMIIQRYERRWKIKF